MGVSESAVKNYVSGRVPDNEKLLLIKNLTNCSLDWLLTGEEAHAVQGIPVSDVTLDKLKTIAKEQSLIIHGDAEISGSERLEAVTLRLLAEYLINRALVSVNLVDEDLLSKADRKRSERFTFIANRPQSIEDRIGEIIDKKLSAVEHISLDREDALRDIIRELVKEEAAHSRKRPVYPLRVADADDDEKIEETTHRKAG